MIVYDSSHPAPGIFTAAVHAERSLRESLSLINHAKPAAEAIKQHGRATRASAVVIEDAVGALQPQTITIGAQSLERELQAIEDAAADIIDGVVNIVEFAKWPFPELNGRLMGVRELSGFDERALCLMFRREAGGLAPLASLICEVEQYMQRPAQSPVWMRMPMAAAVMGEFAKHEGDICVFTTFCVFSTVLRGTAGEAGEQSLLIQLRSDRLRVWRGRAGPIAQQNEGHPVLVRPGFAARVRSVRPAGAGYTAMLEDVVPAAVVAPPLPDRESVAAILAQLAAANGNGPAGAPQRTVGGEEGRFCNDLPAARVGLDDGEERGCIRAPAPALAGRFGSLTQQLSALSPMRTLWMSSGFAPAAREAVLLYKDWVADPVKFHAACDGKAPTVTLLRTSNGAVFGGYSGVAWRSGGGAYAEDAARSSFIFILRSSRVEGPTQLPLEKASRAIFCDGSYGPVFGGVHGFGGHDIWTQGAAGCVAFPHSYGGLPDRSCFDVGPKGKFELREMEVWLWG